MEVISYNLSETEMLVFKPYPGYFELYSGHEGTSNRSKIATYTGGKWVFDDRSQRNLFFMLFTTYKKQFGKAIKFYNSTLTAKDRPKTYIFTCARRRFSIKITKLKRNWWNFIYDTFYGR